MISSATFYSDFLNNPTSIYDGKFFTNSEQECDAKFAIHQGTYNYFNDSDNELIYVELPYKNDNFVLCLILPKVDASFRTILNSLDYDLVSNFFTKVKPRKMEVHVPSIKLKSNTDLSYVMQMIGVCKIFEENEADFSRMCSNNKNLFLESTIVNNEIALQCHTRMTNVPYKPKKQSLKSEQSESSKSNDLRFNRPFLYFIKCDINKMCTFILFSGVVSMIE